MLLSLALQHGVALDTIKHVLTRDGQDQPQSIVGVVVDRLTPPPPPTTEDGAAAGRHSARAPRGGPPHPQTADERQGDAPPPGRKSPTNNHAG